MNWHHQGTALTRFQLVYVQTSNKTPMFAEEPDPGNKTPPLSLSRCLQEKTMERLECSALELFILSGPCSNQPQRIQQHTLFGHGYAWKLLFTVISPRLTRKQKHRMVLKCTLWLKAQKELASGQAMRMNSGILGQRLRWAQLLPAIIWLFKVYLNQEVVN